MGSGNDRGEQWEPTAGLTCSTTKSLRSSGMTTSSCLDIDIRKSIGQDVRKARCSFSHSVLPLILLFLFSNAKCKVFIHIQEGLKGISFLKLIFIRVWLSYSIVFPVWQSESHTHTHTHMHTHTHTHTYTHTHMYIHSFLDSIPM